MKTAPRRVRLIGAAAVVALFGLEMALALTVFDAIVTGATR